MLRADNEVEIGFSVTPRHRVDRVSDLLAKGPRDVVEADVIAVLDRVVQDRDDALGLGLHRQHDAQRVQDVGLAGLVVLAVVNLCRKHDRFREFSHRRSYVWCRRSPSWLMPVYEHHRRCGTEAFRAI